MKRFIQLLSAGTLMVISPILSLAAEAPTGTFVKPAPAMTADERKWHVGVLGGVVNTSDGNNSNTEYGLDIGLQPYIPFGAGLELSRADTGDISRTKLLGRGTYNFGGTQPLISHSYVGYTLGAVHDENTDFDGTFLASGPVLGFDFPLKAMSRRTASLGAQAQYLFTEGSSPDALSLNGQLKFWF